RRAVRRARRGGGGAVRGAVVGDHDARDELHRERVEDERQRALLVEDGNDDGDTHGGTELTSGGLHNPVDGAGSRRITAWSRRASRAAQASLCGRPTADRGGDVCAGRWFSDR